MCILYSLKLPYKSIYIYTRVFAILQRLWKMDEKNGMMWCETYCSLPVVFFHTITGVGTPWAWQCSVIWRFRSTFTSPGSTIQRGGTNIPNIIMDYNWCVGFFVNVLVFVVVFILIDAEHSRCHRNSLYIYDVGWIFISLAICLNGFCFVWW